MVYSLAGITAARANFRALFMIRAECEGELVMYFKIGLLLTSSMCAGSAFADLVPIKPPYENAENPGLTVFAQALNFTGREVGPAVYSSIGSPSFGQGMGMFRLIDDYETTISEPSFILKSFSFAGGVGTPGDWLDFKFFDASNRLVTGFAATLPAAGDYFWNITFDEGLANVPSRGFLQISSFPGSTGQWLMNGSGASVGVNNSAYGSFGGGVGAFEFVRVVPLPPAVWSGGLALLGLAGAMSLRRRSS